MFGGADGVCPSGSRVCNMDQRSPGFSYKDGAKTNNYNLECFLEESLKENKDHNNISCVALSLLNSLMIILLRRI